MANKVALFCVRQFAKLANLQAKQNVCRLTFLQTNCQVAQKYEYVYLFVCHSLTPH